MALENDDLIVVQKNGGGELRKAKIEDISGKWTEDSGNLYPTTLTNNVGIGTDSPDRELHVKGASNVIRAEATGNASRIEFENQNSSAPDAVAIGSVSDDMQFVAGGSERARILDNGNVGIGTDSPSRTLEIKTGTGIAGFKQSTSSLATTLEFLRNGAGTSTNNAIEVSNSEGNVAHIAYDGSAYYAGPVGIGTDSPESRLTINPGNSSNTSIGGRDIAYGVNAITSSGRSGFLVRTNNNFLQDNDNSAFQYLYPFNDGITSDYKVFRTAKGSTLSDVFWTSINGNGYFAGNVGIGTDAPINNLHVRGSSARDSGIALHTTSNNADDGPLISFNRGTSPFKEGTIGNIRGGRQSSGGYLAFSTRSADAAQVNEHLRINNDGEIGIGTDTPSSKLTVQDSKKQQIEVRSDGDANSDSSIILKAKNGSNTVSSSAEIICTAAGRTNSNSDLRFAVRKTGDDLNAPNTVMTLQGAGRVGIGTESPGVKLAVAGSGDATSSNVVASEFTAQVYTDTAFLNFGSVSGKPCIQSSGAGTSYNLILNPFQGNVGIGTDSPRYTLSVSDSTLAEIGVETEGKGEIKLISANDENGHAIRFGGNDGGTTEPRILRFLTSGDEERLRIDSSGNVLIGGTLPSAPNIGLNADGSATFGDTAGVVEIIHTGDTNTAFRLTGPGDVSTVYFKADGEAFFTGDITAGNVTFNLEPENPDNYTTTEEEYEVEVPVLFPNGVATTDLVDGEPERETRTVTRTREVTTYTGPTMDVKDTLLKITEALTQLKTAAASATTCEELRTAIDTALADV